MVWNRRQLFNRCAEVVVTVAIRALNVAALNRHQLASGHVFERLQTTIVCRGFTNWANAGQTFLTQLAHDNFIGVSPWAAKKKTNMNLEHNNGLTYAKYC